jgi:hypothetical protein
MPPLPPVTAATRRVKSNCVRLGMISIHHLKRQ